MGEGRCTFKITFLWAVKRIGSNQEHKNLLWGQLVEARYLQFDSFVFVKLAPWEDSHVI